MDCKDFKAMTDHLRELWLAKGYSASTIYDMEFVLGALSEFLRRNGRSEYTAADGAEFIIHCQKESTMCASRISRAKSVIGKLDRLAQGMDGISALKTDKSRKFALPESLENSLEIFLDHSVSEGNQKTTVAYKRWICGRFLAALAAQGCNDPQSISGELIQSALLSLGYTRYWERLRLYLSFLFEEGLVERDYSGLVHLVKPPMPQPVVYSTEEIRVLEESFDLTSPSGIRNYAITLLMSRYGIRACDVAALTFGNIDFKHGRIHFIQQKTAEPWEAELLPIVDQALRNYIEGVRPSGLSFSQIFLTLTPPYVPANYLTINEMIHQQYKRSGIDILGRKHGSRAFRSSLASNMVNDGMSTEVIRNVLGHSTKHALKHYARIDIRSMRRCPLPVPVPTGRFAVYLSGKEQRTNV